MAATYQNMSYEDIRPISQFSNVNPGNTNVLWGVKNNPYSENNLNPDGTTWNWLCNAIDIYWGKPSLNVTGDVTSVPTPTIATTTDLLKFIETTAQVVNNKVDTNALAFKKITNPSDSSKVGFVNSLSQYYDTNIGKGAVIEGDGKTFEDEEGEEIIYNITASGPSSHAEGYGTTASGYASHAEGDGTTASNSRSHAEGDSTTASGPISHAEGYGTTASGHTSHAEGGHTEARGEYSHAEGSNTIASGNYSHAEGNSTTASNSYSHAEGRNTTANNQSEHASGQYNVSSKTSTTFGDGGNTLFSVGNGTSNSNRHNAFEIRQNGDIYIVKDNADVKLQDVLSGAGVIKVEIPQNTGESVNLPNKGYVFTWNGSVTEYRDMYWNGESESKMIVFVARQYPSEYDNSKLGKIWKAIVCNYDDNSNIISYYDTYTSPDIPDNVLALFNEKEATTTRSGLMSAEDKQKLDNFVRANIIDIKDYMTENSQLPTGGVYIYNGLPTEFKICNEDGSDYLVVFGVMRESINDDYELGQIKSVVLYDYNDENDYMTFREDQLAPNIDTDVLQLFNEEVATSDKKGLMSHTDKQKLDNMPTVFQYSQYCTTGGKIPFNTDFSNYILPCNVEMRMWRNNEYWYLCFATNELSDIDESNTDWMLRKNYYLFVLHDISGSEDRNNYTFVNVYTNNTVLVDQTALGAKVAEAFGYSNNSSNS